MTIFNRVSLRRFALSLLILFGVTIVSYDGSSVAVAKKPGSGGGNEPSTFYHVVISGDVYWENLDGSLPVRLGRLANDPQGNFLVNGNQQPSCATWADPNWARTNLSNVLSNVVDAGTCFRPNVDGDQVYGGTLGIQDTERNLMDDDEKDIQLNIPSTTTSPVYATNGKETSYQLHYSVTKVWRVSTDGTSVQILDLPSGIKTLMRDLASGEYLKLELGGWILEPSKGKNSAFGCSGSGSLSDTYLVLTSDDDPCTEVID